MLFLTSVFFASGQYKFPSIIVMDPYQTKLDSSFSKQIKAYEFETRATEGQKKAFLTPFLAKSDNIKRMKAAEWDYRNKMNYSSTFSFGFYAMLSYIIFGADPKSLVLLTHETSDDNKEKLEQVARKYKVSYVINPVLLSTFLQSGEKVSKVRLPVYDSNGKKVVVNKEYIGSSRNPGFDLTCEEGSFECTFNNITAPAIKDVLAVLRSKD